MFLTVAAGLPEASTAEFPLLAASGYKLAKDEKTEGKKLKLKKLSDIKRKSSEATSMHYSSFVRHDSNLPGSSQR